MNKPILSFFFLILLGILSPARGGIFKEKAGLSPQEKAERNYFDSCRIDAQKGDAQAMGLLGLMYEKGKGTEQDFTLAVKWLKRGAKKGDAQAQNNLGFLYLKGKGVGKNSTRALHWFEKAAAQGLAAAQENLGLVYGGGLGVKKDYEKAFDWFKKAAEQDDAEAQTNLAILYSLGEGGPKDFIESYKWFSLALRHTLPDGELTDLRNDREWLEKRMSGKDVAEAKKLTAQWKPVSSSP